MARFSERGFVSAPTTVVVWKDGGRTSFAVVATHHGVKADASELNSELERIIDEVRAAHPRGDRRLKRRPRPGVGATHTGRWRPTALGSGSELGR
jgi:hypothetical protein